MTDPVEQIRAVHRAIQKLADEKAATHGDRLQCKRGCSACCIDGLTVFEVEADRILADFAEADLGLPSSTGCVFLGEQGECRIYASRPYVCRTQGLPLRWFDEEAQPPTEYRDICELNLDGPPLDELPEQQCWTIGHVESILQQLQMQKTSDLRRVALRDVFDQMSKR